MNSFGQVFAHMINQYPALFAASSLAEAKNKVMDHLFNVIGTGSEMHLFEEIRPLPVRPAYVNGSTLYYVNSEKPGRSEVLTEAEAKAAGLDVSKLVQASDRRKDDDSFQGFFESGSCRPYPNYQKEYSFVWQDVFQHRDTIFNEVSEEWETVKTFEGRIEDLPADWFDAFESYYCQAKSFFSDEYTCRNYSHGFNAFDEDKKLRQIESMTYMLKKYGSNEEISKAYELTFEGDVEAFMKTRWDLERARILNFIDKTLVRIAELKSAKV